MVDSACRRSQQAGVTADVVNGRFEPNDPPMVCWPVRADRIYAAFYRLSFVFIYLCLRVFGLRASVFTILLDVVELGDA